MDSGSPKMAKSTPTSPVTSPPKVPSIPKAALPAVPVRSLPKPPPPEEESNTEETLASYLTSQGIDSNLVNVLTSQKVNLENMKDLTAETLTEFGVTTWGDRNALLKAIKDYNPSEKKRVTRYHKMSS